jgi:hypothetical protein
MTHDLFGDAGSSAHANSGRRREDPRRPTASLLTLTIVDHDLTDRVERALRAASYGSLRAILVRRAAALEGCIVLAQEFRSPNRATDRREDLVRVIGLEIKAKCAAPAPRPSARCRTKPDRWTRPGSPPRDRIRRPRPGRNGRMERRAGTSRTGSRIRPRRHVAVSGANAILDRVQHTVHFEESSRGPSIAQHGSWQVKAAAYGETRL